MKARANNYNSNSGAKLELVYGASNSASASASNSAETEVDSRLGSKDSTSKLTHSDAGDQELEVNGPQ